MKANEAPKKIYISAIDLEEVGYLLTESNDRDDVEYNRTDTFIEKAKKHFAKHRAMGIHHEALALRWVRVKNMMNL